MCDTVRSSVFYLTVLLFHVNVGEIGRDRGVDVPVGVVVVFGVKGFWFPVGLPRS